MGSRTPARSAPRTAPPPCGRPPGVLDEHDPGVSGPRGRGRQLDPVVPVCTTCSGITGVGAGGDDIDLDSNETDSGNDFGNWAQGTKSGTKFEDENANRVRDEGDLPLDGWAIRAYVDTNGDGILQATETTIAADDETDAKGDYESSP